MTAHVPSRAASATPAEVEQIRRLAEEGLTDREIADRSGIVLGRVKQARKQHKIASGWLQRTGARAERPVTPAELAQMRRIAGAADPASDGELPDGPPKAARCPACRTVAVPLVRNDDTGALVLGPHRAPLPGVAAIARRFCTRSWRSPSNVDA